MLSQQNQNLILDLKDWSEKMLAERATAEQIVASWNNNDVFSQLTDSDVQSVFPYLTASEVSNGISAVQAVLAALGDFTTGQAVNLIKLRG